MNALRATNALKAGFQRLSPFARTGNKGAHALAFQRLFWGALAGCLMAFFFGDSPLLENLELSMLELRYTIADNVNSMLPNREVVPFSKNISIVAFDDESQFDLGFPRFGEYNAQEKLADVIDRIEEGKPAIVAIDLDLRGAANPKLVRTLRQNRNVVLAVFGSMEGDSDLPDAAFLKHAAGYGYDELSREADGLFLRLPLSVPQDLEDTSGLTQVPSLVEAIMAAYGNQKGLNPATQWKSASDDQPAYINFKRLDFPKVSMSSVVLDSSFDPAQFKDKIVLIAPTLTPRRQDTSQVVTPLAGRQSHVYGHAEALSSLLNNDIIYSYPRGIAHHILILLGAMFGAVSSILPMGKRAIFAITGATALVVVAQLAFQLVHLALPVVAPLAMLGSGFILGTVIYLDTDLRLRNRELAAARESMQVRAEEERKRIAEDLHDETLPALSAVARMIDELGSNKSDNGTVSDRMRLKLDATIQEMRRVINDLHPSVLETMGFVPALENLAVILERDSGIAYSFTDRNAGQPEYELSDFAKLQLYRIVQEGLNNVGKHSQGSKVEVRLQRNHENLEILIVDNGKGINPKAIRKDSHGLLNIRHRAQLIGAHVEWRRPQMFESGTEMRISIPLVAEENNNHTTYKAQTGNLIDSEIKKGTGET